MWFVQVIDNDGVIRYVPVNADTQGAAREAVRPLISSFERIGRIAGRNFFEAQGVTNLPSDDTAITVAPSEQGLTNWQQQMADKELTDAQKMQAALDADKERRRREGTQIRGGAEAEFGPMFRAGLADRDITLGGGGGIEGRLAEQARNPFFSRSLASAAFRDPSIEALGEEGARTAMPSFQEMVRTGALYGGDATQQARDLLTQAQGFGRDFTGTGALAGSILNPGTVSEGSNLANIAREAGRQRYGSFARFLPQAGSLSEDFFAQPADQYKQTFANFLNQKIFGV